MNWYFLPAWLVSILAFIGLSVLSQALLYMMRMAVNYIVFKEPYRSDKEMRYFLLLEENKKLKDKLSELEEQNDQISRSIIKQLQDKL
jgi:hypothetical protein